MIENLTCIAFDADDTLWENEEFYADAEMALANILHRFDESDVLDVLAQTENRNMDCLGYGAKAMALSMIEAAIAIDPHIAPANILEIVQLGKKLMEVPTIMRPKAVELIEKLRSRYRVIIITKGELNEQQRKFTNSPLPQDIDYFVLDSKTPEQYRRLFAHENIDISRLVMIGNSPKSDILPIVELGGQAIFVPSTLSWAHECAVLPESPLIHCVRNLSDVFGLLGLSD